MQIYFLTSWYVIFAIGREEVESRHYHKSLIFTLIHKKNHYSHTFQNYCCSRPSSWSWVLMAPKQTNQVFILNSEIDSWSLNSAIILPLPSPLYTIHLRPRISDCGWLCPTGSNLGLHINVYSSVKIFITSIDNFKFCIDLHNANCHMSFVAAFQQHKSSINNKQ